MTSGAQAKIMKTPATDLLICFALALSVHLIYRFFAQMVATAVALQWEEWICTVLMCSQKSLPVCVSVISTLPPALQQKEGILIIPCIMRHFLQLVIAGFLAKKEELDPN